ncbi:hypothetical protein M0R45_011610 [Rubus argutus]|uniref:Arf-GAP domain-containing protein n=1 Tax=Rubus argutus TaxID=59490 RepID=A0AAW1YAM8_RUBAR
MGNRIKEEEKTERIIRGLLKLPENKRCMNCNSMGPQYVCTTFLTFVCTNCSGVHREFTHRVKSVSMAKFTAEEVSSLQAGGNERARQIYFKEFDPQYHSFPDGSNINRLRDFIKHVYVDRKYTGERSVQKLPKLRLNEEPDESRKVGAYHGGSRSFHDEERKERNYTQGSSPSVRDQNVVKYYYDERRSPRYYQENSRNGGFKRNPLRFEIVDNRIRDDRKARSGFPTGESRSQSRTPENKKNMDSSSFPVVPFVKGKPGENVLPPQVGEISIANDQKHAGGSAHNQKMKSMSSHDGNAVEHEKENLESLIDFNTDPRPSHDAAKSQPQQTPPLNNDSNWASFESSTKEKASQLPKPDTLESLLFELSTPTSVPAITASEAPSNDDAPSTACTNNMPAGGVAPDAPAEQMLSLFDTVGASTYSSISTSVPVQPSDAGPVQALPTSGGDTSVRVTDAQQLPSTQQDQYSISFASESGSTSQHTITPVGASNGLSRTSSLAPNTQGSLSVSAETPSQSMLRTQSLPVETKSSEREELPLDLFAASYSSIPSQASGWHTGPPHGMGFHMQYYPNIAPAPAFPVSRKPTNPFDLNDNKSVVPSTHFPSMSSMEDALHNVSVPPSLMHTSSLGSYSSHLKPPQSPSHKSMMPSHSLPSYAGFSPGMGEQLHNNAQFLRPHEIGGFSSDEAAVFGTLSTSQQPSIRYPAPNNSETFSPMGGNPFG